MGSSFSSPFRHLPLHHPSLHASFEASLFVSLRTLFASSEVLSAFLKAPCYDFHVLLFNNGIDHPLTINPPFNSRIGGSLRFLPEIFGFDFFKIISAHFEKPSPPTHPSIVFLVSAAVVRLSNLRHPTSTHLRVDLTRRCVLSTRRPLRSCISSAAYSPLPSLSLAYFHMLLFVTFYFSLLLCYLLWVLVSIWFLAVPALQLSLYSNGCFTRIGLFIEFLCVLNHLKQPWNRPDLLIIFFELLVITIASCSVLLDRIQYCPYFSTAVYHLGYIVGEPTHFSFFGSPTSSSFRIRSDKDHSI
jgi:hypothetical protein